MHAGRGDQIHRRSGDGASSAFTLGPKAERVRKERVSRVFFLSTCTGCHEELYGGGLVRNTEHHSIHRPQLTAHPAAEDQLGRETGFGIQRTDETQWGYDVDILRRETLRQSWNKQSDICSGGAERWSLSHRWRQRWMETFNERLRSRSRGTRRIKSPLLTV
ncbi:hypothetical protein NHX12_017201 [Muraenolepis orangiensis]|uniref:Uncharacterized protein n=1 Tax=Muraenolepis orangiensis TaxID=630683 RepID=A0A9Q0I175_9TELE|nr:hypothetical protein NHX12_017201 [Muraenolepis orangiensis]